MSRWRTSIFMFLAVLVAEFAIMSAFEVFPLPVVHGQAAALTDAILLGACVLFAYLVIGAGFAGRRPTHLFSNAIILVVVAVAFESQLHLTGQEFEAALGARGVDVLNAFMTASVVAAITAWLTMVDDRVSSLDRPSISLYRALGRSIVLGAVVAAGCVAAVPFLAGMHAANMEAVSRNAWEVVELAGQERAISQRLGRLALIEEEAASPYFGRSVAAAEAQGAALGAKWRTYVGRDQLTVAERGALPDYRAIEAARERYLETAHALELTTGPRRAQLRRDLQAAIDTYAPQIEGAANVIAALERQRQQLNDPALAQWLAPIILFMLALGMLWPLLRLVAAQQGQLQDAFQTAQDLARRDTLTGLGNRRLLTEEFAARAESPNPSCAVLMLDLDRFKPINDVHGHLIGDRVLEIVAERLRKVVRADCAIARLGGDEFAVLTELGGEAGAQALAARIIEAITQPISTSGLVLSVGTSIGIAVYPRDATTAEALLDRADAALYRAKERRGEAHVFDAAMDEDIRQRAALESELRAAIEAGEIEPHYQPIVDLKTGLPIAHEVLARWRHKTKGFIPPSVFIPVAEDAGLIDALFWRLLRTACAAHLGAGANTRLSVNLSPAQLKDELLPQRLLKTLTELRFPADKLEVEVTEGAMLADIERTKPLLQSLKNQGATVALDDFGTGYSSLQLLRDLPIDKVKIDQSFVCRLSEASEADLAIIEAILGMAKAMQVDVIAEGVETERSRSLLMERGCRFAQGYLFGAPEPDFAAASKARSVA